MSLNLNTLSESKRSYTLPSDYFYSLFSALSYVESPEEDESYWPSLSKHNWIVFKTYKGKKGYFGVAFLNEQTRQVVISNRGTVPTKIQTVLTDLEGIVFNRITEQQREADKFVRNVIQELLEEKNIYLSSSLKDFQLSFTGHSLGAWIAEKTCISFRNGHHAIAITFDSPGSFTMLKNLQTTNIYSDMSFQRESPRIFIRTYLSAPNLINTCNPHFGEVRRIYPQVETNNFEPKTKSLTFQENYKLKFEVTYETKIPDLSQIKLNYCHPQISKFLTDYLKIINKFSIKMLSIEESNLISSVKIVHKYFDSNNQPILKLKKSKTNNSISQRFFQSIDQYLFWIQNFLVEQYLSLQNNNQDKNQNFLNYLKLLKKNKQKKTIPNTLNLNNLIKWKLPNKNPKFVGRTKEIEMIENNFIKNKLQFYFQIITGPGGIGKTQLCIQLSNLFYDNNVYHNILYFAGESNLDLQILYLSDLLNIPHETEPKPKKNQKFQKNPDFNSSSNQLIQQIYSKISSHGNTLIIFDDITDVNLISKYLPKKTLKSKFGRIHFLITSRNNQNWEKLIQKKHEEEEENEIEKEEKLEVKEKDKIEKSQKNVNTFILNGFTEKESITFINQFLTEEQQETQKVYIQKFCERFYHFPLILSQIIQFIIDSKISIKENLNKFEIYEQNHKKNIFTTNIMNNHNQTFKTLYSSLDISFENYEQDLIDLILSLAFLDSKDISISFLKTLSQSELQFNKLMNALNCQSIISRSHQQNQLYCSVHPLFQEIQTLGKEHLEVAKSYNNIGLVHYSKGNYEQALEFHQKSLKIKIQTLGKEHPDVATNYNNIGLVHDSKGNYEQALEFYQKSLKIRIQTLGKEHPDVARNYNNIGSVHDSKGNYEQALEFYQKSLEIRIQTLGKEHPDVAKSYNNIGSVHYSKGNYEQALEFHQKSLKIKIQTLGKEHPSVATSYNNIAGLHSQLLYGLEIFDLTKTDFKDIDTWINKKNTKFLLINPHSPRLIYKKEAKIDPVRITIYKRRFKLIQKLKILHYDELINYLPFRKKESENINWYSKNLKQLENELENFRIKNLENSPSWKVQEYLKIVQINNTINKQQRYLKWKGSTSILKLRNFTNYLNRYSYVMNKNKSKLCELCKKINNLDIIEDLDHFLWNCSAYENNRKIWISELKKINISNI
ncbi:tetratricopeptide repeat protein [Anaeramoeba flamelloides]|uniref:Tetratricopeptide repeat protein n=1 Tax=Anaeramoeba flamelloides TaxID=1746091 RepID=A0AAV7Y1U9_9EUKA|nr:tetratricopeptide repeat protein [Anaeramoeba flamelloides]